MRFFFACQRDLLLKVILCCAELCGVVELARQTTMRRTDIVVLERQTSEKLRLCRTGSVAHFKSYADDVLAWLTSEKLRR